jgi:hypothetical protein
MLASYATLINLKLLIPSARTQYVAVDKDHLVDFLKPTLRQIFVDEAWYLATNPDVAEAIADGIVQDAKDHYISAGYYEHRMPYEIRVDGEWYLAQYADVQEAVKTGKIATPRDRAPWRGVELATSSRSPARLAGFIRLPRRAT